MFNFLKKKDNSYELMQQAAARYFDGTQKIGTMWSVLYNLKKYEGEPAEALEAACYKNLEDLEKMLETSRAAGFSGERPTEVPAYVRLCMLYEKQERYAEAIRVCAEAIRAGAVYDKSSGQMYGRLARLIRKAGMDQDPELLKLTQEGAPH